MKHVLETIERLNAPKEVDGEILESSFNFIIKEDDGMPLIVDTNENYSIDYLAEQNALMRDCAIEFGFKFKPILHDEIMEQLEEAVKKDFGNDAYIEWYTHLEMQIAI